MKHYSWDELLSLDLSPMMKQYLAIKNQYRDLILFYRLGDFYEMFFEDAYTASRELEITLTGRDCGLEEKAPMCGVPYHAVDSYIATLTSLGYKVGICEQMEDPRAAKGIVKREIIRIITPGTVTEQGVLDGSKNNFLCSAYLDGLGVSLVFADISTGETDILKNVDDGKSDGYENILSGFSKYQPKEVIVNSRIFNNKKFMEIIKQKFCSVVNLYEDSFYEFEAAIDKIKTKFSEKEIEDNNINSCVQSIYALYALLSYIEDTQKIDLKHMNSLECYEEKDFADIDIASRRSLELTETMRDKRKKGTLLWVIDSTKTSMGARLLRRYVDLPLKSAIAIDKRHAAVAELFSNTSVRNELRDILEGVYDIERLCSKIAYRSVNGKELISLKNSLKLVPDVKRLIKDFNSYLLREIDKECDSLEDLSSLVERAIREDCGQTITEGEIIKHGYNEQLDKYTDALTNGKKWLAEIEAKEKERTGIKNLRTGYNRVFGYYIEVTASNISLVPEDYIRKQTLTNAERYITPELKEIENTILSATEKRCGLEYQLFCEVRDVLFDNVIRIQKTAKALAKLDVFAALAETAYKNNYVRPTLNTEGKIIIKDGRHPVVEKTLSDGGFVANDTYLDKKDNSFAIITGPNMAGKSTYMRQVALICLMSQIGSFVPASMASLPVVDKIFTRVGASDDLAAGQSTFMVEMTEVSNILHNATADSLVILDEIGRGTSTFDGLSIAWAVVEYILSKIGSKTLFATHYHELSILENRLRGVRNYSIAVRKRGDDITFLRKITEGGCDDSFGIQVAKLAGVPSPVLKRAKDILKILESKETAVNDIDLKGKKILDYDAEGDDQVELDAIVGSDIIDELKAIDTSNMTPLEALTLLDDLSSRARISS